MINTIDTVRTLWRPKVFVSHSHQDRHTATDLQRTLEKHGAEIYLDQDRIRPGDVLPSRVLEGIGRCDTFLLIWSASAASSEWVHRECSTAQVLKKKIVPYVLDSTRLPPNLEYLVHIKLEDRKHGDANLLTTIFPNFTPDPSSLFPGRWQAWVDVPGLDMIRGTYELELRPNGQLEGEVSVNATGLVAMSLDFLGLSEVCIPISGSWSYDQPTQMLTLELWGSGFGHQTHDTVMIRASGREGGAISGQDLARRVWKLQRLS